MVSWCMTLNAQSQQVPWLVTSAGWILPKAKMVNLQYNVFACVLAVGVATLVVVTMPNISGQI